MRKNVRKNIFATAEFIVGMTVFAFGFFGVLRLMRDAGLESRNREAEIETYSTSAFLEESAELIPEDPSEVIGVEAVPALAPYDIGCSAEVLEPLTGADGITAWEYEIDLAARLVFLESGTESAECQRYVADCIFNRLRYNTIYGTPIIKEWGSSLYEVMSATECSGDPAFTKWAEVYSDKAVPTDEIREIVRAAFYDGSTIPHRIMYFATKYQSWAVDEFSIDHTYFSSSPWVSIND